MRRSVVAVAAALVALFLTGVSAAPQEKWARGKITAVSGASITLDVKGQAMTFVVNESTEVIARGAGTKAREAEKMTGAKPKLTDVVKVGDNVEVSYAEAGGTMTAKIVRGVGAAPATTSEAAAATGSKHMEGVVSEVSGASLTVKPATGDAMVFMVDAKVRVTGTGLGTLAKEKQAKGESITLTDAVGVGDTVEVTYTTSGDMKHGTAVRVIKKKTT